MNHALKLNVIMVILYVCHISDEDCLFIENEHNCHLTSVKFVSRELFSNFDQIESHGNHPDKAIVDVLNIAYINSKQHLEKKKKRET